ncbi:hypothetical protein BLA60_10985 [Actinophytocola xinjiangensis]|uniref:ABC-2 type transport system permease protein n=1 Tax=Actinophytocola xinjiangensis TaxID=485602 RepID=A0A7Z0WRM7_9PSEU|nr:hypothetical protein [Actinophytocola xinjiangensis]OLF11488.1 hypothetical protein BLA60_10985 [Actinophytocola xinjiangensis]
MRAFAARWLSGDERTLGALLGIGVLTMAFFRLDRVREVVGVGAADDLTLVLVTAALLWWSMLSRGFVWLEPAALTWRDADLDRRRLITGRLVGGWLARLVTGGYVLALLAAVAGLSRTWVLAGAFVLAGGGLLAWGAVRRVRRDARLEAVVVVGLALAAMVPLPGPSLLFVAAGVLAVAGGWLLGLSGPVARPEIADAGRTDLVAGWRDRLMRVVGVRFLDPTMLLPAGRPVRAWSLLRPVGLRLAFVGVAARARYLPAAGLLALTAVAASRALPGLPGEVVLGVLGYLALMPLAGGLGELWRSPGRRRWLGQTDTALRAAHLLVLTAVALAWTLPILLLWDTSAVPDLGTGTGGETALPASGDGPLIAVSVSTVAIGDSGDLGLLLVIPLLAASAVRTVTGNPPTFDNLGAVDTPFGAMPLRLIARTLRGPDIGALALVFLLVGGPLTGAIAVALALVVAVLR